MTREEFSKELRRLRLSMARAKISPEEVDVLYSDLSFIPSTAWPSIVSLAIQKWDSWPRNLIKETKELWYSWLSSNPKYQAPLQSTICYQCHSSSGFIWARKRVDDLSSPIRDYYATAVFRCSHCDNAQSSKAIPRYTRQQITDLGYEIDDAGRYSPQDDLTVHKSKPPEVRIKSIPSSPSKAELEQRRQSQKRALEAYLGERDDDIPF